MKSTLISRTPLQHGDFRHSVRVFAPGLFSPWAAFYTLFIIIRLQNVSYTTHQLDTSQLAINETHISFVNQSSVRSGSVVIREGNLDLNWFFGLSSAKCKKAKQNLPSLFQNQLFSGNMMNEYDEFEGMIGYSFY